MPSTTPPSGLTGLESPSSHAENMRSTPPTDAFWDKKSKRYDDAVQNHDAIYERRNQRTKSLLKKTDVVLDFACATGEIALDVAPHVKQVHGIDLSEKMIERAHEKARERRIDNVSFSRTDVFDPRLASRSFSAIMALNIFHLLRGCAEGPGSAARLAGSRRTVAFRNTLLW